MASADAGRIEVVDLETLQYTGQSIGEPFGGGTPKPGRVATEVEGLAVAEEAGLLFAVDEQIGRVLAYDLTSPDLFDPDADFATVGSFGHFGHENGEFSGPDGLVIGGNRMAIADQENDRVQIFELDDVIEHLTR